MKKVNGQFLNAERRTRLLLLIALLAACTAIFRDYLFGQEVLVFNDIGSDTYQLYTMHFASIINHLREGSFSIWDFTNGFGFNQFNLNLFDPSEMLVFLMGYFLGPGRVLFYLVLVQIAKILAAGWVFYHFLSCFSFSRQAKFVMAFVYGLNGYLLVWGQHYQFGMVTIYFPLMLLFMEKYLQGRRSGRALPAVVFLSGIYSVYFSFMSLLGVGIYLLFRLGMMEQLPGEKTGEETAPAGTGKSGRKSRLFSGKLRLLLGGCARILLGLALSMVVFLPMAYCILRVSGRLETEESAGIAAWIVRTFRKFAYDKYYQSVLLRLFSTAFQTTGELADDYYETWLNYYEDPVLFCSVFMVLANLQLVFVYWKQRFSVRKKLFVYLAAGLIAFSLLFPLSGAVFNGLSTYSGRFSYVLTPFFLLGAAWVFDYLKNAGRLNVIVLAASCVLVWFVCSTGYDQSVFTEYRWNAVIAGITGIGAAVCMFLASRTKKETLRRISMWVLTGLILVNVGMEGWTNYEDRASLRRLDTPGERFPEEVEAFEEAMDSDDPVRIAYAKISYPQGYFRDLYNPDIQNALSYIEMSEPEFVRVEKDYIPNTTTISMDGLAQGYRGLTSYNSVQNAYLIDFVDTYCPEIHYPDRNHFLFAGIMQDAAFDAAMGVRYVLSQGGIGDTEHFELVAEYGIIKVYKNRLDTGVARYFDRSVSEESLRKLCTPETRNFLLNSVVALPDGEQIASLEELPGYEEEGEKREEKEKGEGQEKQEETGEQEETEGQEEEEKQEEGEKQEETEREKKQDKQEEQKKPAGQGQQEKKNGSTVTLLAPQKDNRIEGTAHIEKDGFLLFTIPYGEGWSIRIDGKETDVLRGDLGFIACRIPEGDHTLLLTFHAPWLREGALVSAVSLLLYMFCLLFAGRKKKKA